MPWTPIGIQNNNAAWSLSAEEFDAPGGILNQVYDQAVADASSGPSGGDVNIIDVTQNGVQRTTAGVGLGVANVAALNAIIAGLGSTTASKVIYFPPGVYDLQGVINPIITTNTQIQGAGMGSTTLRQEADSLTGRFFTLGQVNAGATADDRPGRVGVRDMALVCMNTPAGNLPDTSPAIWIQGASNWTVENIYTQQISQFIRLGVDATDDESPHGGYVNNIMGTLADAGGTIVHVRRGSSVVFSNIELHVSSGTVDGTAILIEPMGGPSPNAVEGIEFIGCHIWSLGTGANTQAACLRVNLNAGTATNIWFTDCVMDFGSTAVVDIISTGSFAGLCRYLKFTNVYLGGMGGVSGVAGSGNRVRIQNNAPLCMVVSTTFDNCMMGMRSTPAIDVGGTGTVIDTKIIGCQFIDRDNATPKTAAITMAKGDFTVMGCKLRGFDGATTGTSHFIETTANVGDFTVLGNRAVDLASGGTFFSHFDYSSHAHSAQGRVVRDNSPYDMPSIASAATLKIPPHADFVTVTGNTAITSIQGPTGRLITLRFAANCTVTESATLRLSATGGNMITDDTLTLASNNGASWWEVARTRVA